MEEKILIIDDEMHPDGSTDKRYGHLSEKDLANQIKSFIESLGFCIVFAKSGKEGLDILISDEHHEIKLVLLDNVFKGVGQTMQGPTIFRKIKELTSDLPIIIITITPTRKLAGKSDIFKEFVDLGASLYMEKKYLTRRNAEQINFINAIARKADIEYFLKYSEGCDYNKIEILDIDIVRMDGDENYSILKNPIRIRYPMSEYVEQCVVNFPNPVHWKENRATSIELSDIEFHKSVYKLNNTVLRSSGGRIPSFLERLGTAGCRLSTNPIIKILK